MFFHFCFGFRVKRNRRVFVMLLLDERDTFIISTTQTKKKQKITLLFLFNVFHYVCVYVFFFCQSSHSCYTRLACVISGYFLWLNNKKGALTWKKQEIASCYDSKYLRKSVTNATIGSIITKFTQIDRKLFRKHKHSNIE